MEQEDRGTERTNKKSGGGKGQSKGNNVQRGVESRMIHGQRRGKLCSETLGEFFYSHRAPVETVEWWIQGSVF